MPSDRGVTSSKQDVLDVAREHGGLDRGADGHGFVRVDVAARIAAEEAGNLLLDQGHARLAADQDHFVDVADGEVGIGERDAAGAHGALDQVFDQRLDLGPRDLHDQVLRPRVVRRDVRQVDFRLGARRQLDLRLLRGLLQALQGDRVVVEVDAVLLFELIGQVLDDLEVEVLAAEERIAVGGEHLELVLAVHLGDFDDRDVERAAAEIEYRDLGVAALLVHAVGEGRRGRLVDDALHVEAGDPARVLGGLALRVVEVRRHGDDGLGDVLAQVFLGGALHLLQHFRRDLRRRELLAVAFDPRIAVVRLDDLVGHHRQIALDDVVFELAPDQPLDGEQGVGWIGDGLALGALADEHLAVRERDDGRRRAVALGVLDHARLPPVHHGHARIRGAEVYPNDL